MTAIRRYNVHLVSLDPARGGEIRKTRPCVVVSPDEMNRHIRTVIVAPMTSVKRDYPVRVDVTFQGKEGQVVLDQYVRWTRRGSSDAWAVCRKIGPG